MYRRRRGSQAASKTRKLFKSIEQLDAPAVKNVLKSRRVTEVVRDDFTCLQYVATLPSSARGEEVCRVLIEAGADVNARRRSNGASPLLIAARSDSLHVLRALLDTGRCEMGAVRTTDGASVLHILAARGSAEAIVMSFTWLHRVVA